MSNYPYELSRRYASAMECEKRFLFLYGGAGSGKSQFAARKLLYRILHERDAKHRFLIVRKEKCRIRDSMYVLLKDIIEHYNISNQFKFQEEEMKITCIDNDNQIISAGLRDSEKIKSISGITGIWVEEAFELEQKDFDQLNLRLRGITDCYKQIICTFNPMDADHWLKAFMDKHPDNLFSLQTTFYDNMFIDKEYMDELINQYKQNENYTRVYINGDWGRAYTGGEFYHGFSYSTHVGNAPYNPQLPLHISFDFNVHPYLTCSVWQIEKNAAGQLKKAMQIDELCLTHPANTTKQVCAEFKRKYFHEKGHRAGLFVYGDPAGKHEDTRSEKGYNDYIIIKNELQPMNPTLRVASKAPHVKRRGDFMNSILKTDYGGISITIDNACRKTIDDFMYLKQDANGDKLKEKSKDMQTNVVYEKYGHTSDSADYFITYVFSSDFDYFTNGKKTFNPIYGRNKDNRVW